MNNIVNISVYFQTRGLIVPVKDIRNMTVTWPIPDLMPYYRSNVGTCNADTPTLNKLSNWSFVSRCCVNFLTKCFSPRA